MNEKPETQPLPRLRVRVLRSLELGGRKKQHVAAGSGIAKVASWIYAVPDDELFLAGFRLDCRNSRGKKTRLFSGTLPKEHAERKRLKPDLEAVIHLPRKDGKPGFLLAVPSGSKANRINGALVPLTRTGRTKKPVAKISFEALYEKLRTLFAGELNIEGTTISESTLSLFQRGNTASGINAVVRLDASNLVEELLRTGCIGPERFCDSREYNLGELDGVPLTFTDACIVDGRQWVVLAAEDTRDSYEDGKCIGTVLAYIAPDGSLVKVGLIDYPSKVEGLVAERKGNAIRFYFVTDADDRKIASRLLTTSVPAEVSI